jgi:hypothetical protein
MRRVMPAVILILALASPLRAAEPIVAAKTGTFTHGALGLTVVAAEVTLPAGHWQVSAVVPAKVLEQVYLVPEAAPEGAPVAGRRMRLVETEKSIAAGRNPLFPLFFACREYAASHQGRGPDALSDLDARRYAALRKTLEHYFLVPGVAIAPQGRPPVSVGPATVLAVELRPFVDDGKHWVVFNDGRVERRPIDPDLVAKHNLTITFVRAKDAAEAPSGAATIRHAVFALLRSPGAPAATLTLAEQATGARTQVRWSLAGAAPGAPQLLAEWARARAREWAPLAARAPILQTWTARASELYGAAPGAPSMPGMMREPVRTTDAFAILGGRAALSETLQLELLRPRTAGAEPATVPLSSLKGVEVKSHPFAEMLAGKEGAKPAALFPLLEHGGDFLFRAGGLFTKSAVDDDVKGRYLRRLGLVEGQARRLLESGEVTELALVTSDLFFIDGTDATVLMRFKSEGMAEQVLKAGRSAHRERRGELLVVSTSRSELEAVLGLGAGAGAGSLGRSAEFRYMLTQLPLKPDTRALIYLSDPFIRRMVGPGVKIAQLRRMRARAEMEMITAGALLSMLDGGGGKPQLERLIQLGYVPAAAAAGGYRLRDDLAAVSPLWGSSAELAPIGAAAVDKVTASEAQAYRAYVDEYARYWRQYFDPIAMRLDDAPGGALELSTFILPLLDSQLYDQVRAVLAVRESGTALRVPIVTPDPVFLLSLNMPRTRGRRSPGA